MPGLFDGTPLERPVTCPVCGSALDRCTCSRDASGKVLLPRHQPARVSREKRRNGKVMTIVTGLDQAASDLPDLCGQLKKACAAGGTVAQGRIEIQGDHRAQVVDFLREQGYPARTSGG